MVDVFFKEKVYGYNQVTFINKFSVINNNLLNNRKDLIKDSKQPNKLKKKKALNFFGNIIIFFIILLKGYFLNHLRSKQMKKK